MKKIIRFEENMPAIKIVIYNNAPHGSGINGKYENIHAEHYGRCNQNRIIIDNVFDYMNKNGFYNYYLKFRVTIGEDLVPKIRFKNLSQHEKYIVEREDLRSYLEDVYYDWLNNDEEMLELLTKVF